MNGFALGRFDNPYSGIDPTKGIDRDTLDLLLSRCCTVYQNTRVCVNMYGASQPDDPFVQASTGFVQWFTGWPGTRLNPRIQLADLRAEGAGRGVGKSLR